jgi:PhzF family phenazine biosynthesis protein
MTTLTMYQVDAFTAKLFGGNPAAVVPLREWLADDLMQAIAGENNLSETAFFVPEGDGYRIRWFTPTREVPLCGHATLASAWVIFHHLEPSATRVSFQSQSGPLAVERLADDWLELDFPNLPCEAVPVPQDLADALGVVPEACFAIAPDANTMVVLGNAAAVDALEPDLRALKGMSHLGLGLIATAPGDDCDFVSRYFAPAGGIDEDPVTGSIHSVLTPYWAERLGREKLDARQVSKRGGVLRCALRGDRVAIAGQAVSYLQGSIRLPE